MQFLQPALQHFPGWSNVESDGTASTSRQLAATNARSASAPLCRRILCIPKKLSPSGNDYRAKWRINLDILIKSFEIDF